MENRKKNGYCEEDLNKIKAWCEKNIDAAYVLFRFGTVMVMTDSLLLALSKAIEKTHNIFEIVPELPVHRFTNEENFYSVDSDRIDTVERIKNTNTMLEKHIYAACLLRFLDIGYPTAGTDDSDKFIQFLQKDQMWTCQWRHYDHTVCLYPQQKDWSTDTVKDADCVFGHYGLREDYLFLDPYYIHATKKVASPDFRFAELDPKIFDNPTEKQNMDPKLGVRVFSMTDHLPNVLGHIFK